MFVKEDVLVIQLPVEDLCAEPLSEEANGVHGCAIARTGAHVCVMVLACASVRRRSV